ncbi:hypothetical protein Slala05_04100 [Streptomyces lavendulae subsp. lavendulae]|nr:hypothetical protein Slala05_04100 [Streptomyces lavendulae subsp. lavendulae]
MNGLGPVGRRDITGATARTVERGGTGGRYLRAEAVRLLGDGPSRIRSPAALESSCPLAIYESDPTMDRIQVKKNTKTLSSRIPGDRRHAPGIRPTRTGEPT